MPLAIGHCPLETHSKPQRDHKNKRCNAKKVTCCESEAAAVTASANCMIGTRGSLLCAVVNKTNPSCATLLAPAVDVLNHQINQSNRWYLGRKALALPACSTCSGSAKFWVVSVQISIDGNPIMTVSWRCIRWRSCLWQQANEQSIW